MCSFLGSKRVTFSADSNAKVTASITPPGCSGSPQAGFYPPRARPAPMHTIHTGYIQTRPHYKQSSYVLLNALQLLDVIPRKQLTIRTYYALEKKQCSRHLTGSLRTCSSWGP